MSHSGELFCMVGFTSGAISYTKQALLTLNRFGPTSEGRFSYQIILRLLRDFCRIHYRITMSKQRKAGQRDRTSNNLQRKISRIILTNGCCWIPVCILAFISAGGRLLSQSNIFSLFRMLQTTAMIGLQVA